MRCEGVDLNVMEWWTSMTPPATSEGCMKRPEAYLRVAEYQFRINLEPRSSRCRQQLPGFCFLYYLTSLLSLIRSSTRRGNSSSSLPSASAGTSISLPLIHSVTLLCVLAQVSSPSENEDLGPYRNKILASYIWPAQSPALLQKLANVSQRLKVLQSHTFPSS